MEAKDKKIIVEPIPIERVMDEAYKLGIAQGRREVLKWMETFEQNQYYIFVKQESLQAFCKERGL